MKKMFAVLIFIAISHLMIGCSKSSEYVSISPKTTASYTNIGHGQSLFIAVNTDKIDTNIGFHNAPELNKNLKNKNQPQVLSSNLNDELQQQLKMIAYNKGFSVKAKKTAAIANLTVKINFIHYHAEAHGFHVRNITQVAMKAIVHHKDKTFSKLYHGYDVYTPWIYSGPGAIKKNISNAFNKAITNFANDDSLWKHVTN